MQGYALIANIVRKQEARLSGRLEGEYAIFRHGYSSPRVAGTLIYRSGDRLIELQAARYREIDDEHGFGSRNRFTPDGSPLRLVDYAQPERSEENTSELQSLMRISYAVFCLKKKKHQTGSDSATNISTQHMSTHTK